MKNGNQQATNPPRKIFKLTFYEITNKVISIICILTIYRIIKSIKTTGINVITLKMITRINSDLPTTTAKVPAVFVSRATLLMQLC